MTITVATTLHAFAMSDRDFWGRWLDNAAAIRESTDHDVRYFAAIQEDGRGRDPFWPLLGDLNQLGGDYWFYALDDRREEIHTNNRLRHITAGQNLCTDYSVSVRADYMLFMAADCAPPPDALPKLLEPFEDDFWQPGMVGGQVDTYCLDGEVVEELPGDCRQHMPTAAFVLIESDLFRRVRWRWDYEHGSDDPCYYQDAREHGYRPVVRHDCVGKHYPESIGPIETRIPGRDMRVY